MAWEPAFERTFEHAAHECRVAVFPHGGGFLWSLKIIGTGIYEEAGGRPASTSQGALNEGVEAAREILDRRAGGQDVGGAPSPRSPV